MTAAIVVDGLTKVYGDQRAVDNLSFEVPWESVTGFLGPNGAGKSTTMRMILGLASIDEGRAEVLGTTYAALDEPAATVGSLLETQQFHPQRTAIDHLRVYAAAASVPDARIDEVLGMVELTGKRNKKVGQYSLGMRQRLGLATALLGDPRVLILDEPANGLDPLGIRWLRSFLRSFAAEGRAVFLSSHLLSEVAQMVDDVVVINNGRLVVHSDVHTLVSQEQNLEDVFLQLTGSEER